MVCFRDPLLRPLAARAAELGNVATYELLGRLGHMVSAGTLQHALSAAERLRREGIYGFWLMHEYFGQFSTCVFTEAGLKRAAEVHPLGPPQELRWAVYWAETVDITDPELRAVASVLGERERTMADREEAECVQEVELRCLQALKRVRDAGVFDASVVLALGAAEQSAAETYAYAEQLSNAAALRAFRKGLSRLDDAEVEAFRKTVARL